MSHQGGAETDRLQGPADWLGDGGGAVLSEDERPRYSLSSTDGFEHTTAGRTRTSAPADGHDTYLVATNRRVLVVLGDEPGDPEAAFAYELVTDCRVEGGLLSTAVAVETHDESIEFPVADGDAEAAVGFVETMASHWRELATQLSEAEDAIESVEAADDVSTYDVTKAREHLSAARDVIAGVEEAPTGAMAANVDRYEEKLERARTSSATDSAEERLDDAEESLLAATEALDADRYLSACEAYLDAADAVGEARSTVAEIDGQTELRDRLASLGDRVEAFGEEYLADAEADCERALAADDPAVAVEAWQSAFDRYGDAVDAGWDGQAGASRAALSFQRAWVASALLDALEARATAAAARGDDCDDDDAAQDHYDEAVATLERARDLAERREFHSPDEYEAAIERVTDRKLERSGWQFGSAGDE